MFDPATYTFPSEDELFVHQVYTDARDEAKARTTAILAKSYGQTAGILLGSFIAVSILLVGAHSGLSRVEQQFQEDARR
jgi:hypothetical protein